MAGKGFFIALVVFILSIPAATAGYYFWSKEDGSTFGSWFKDKLTQILGIWFALFVVFAAVGGYTVYG